MERPGDRSRDVSPSDPRDLVRVGYDLVSRAYRRDDFALEGSHYGQWLARLVPMLTEGARALDLGCEGFRPEGDGGHSTLLARRVMAPASTSAPSSREEPR